VSDGGRAWIVMEPLNGPTLAEEIRRAGSLSPDQVVAIGIRLLEALQAIHREGVIHGDLKPSNVQMVGSGRPVLTDFGLASCVGDTAVGPPADLVGSPAYMAPEVLRTGARTRSSDLFSLGATLYEAAEGRRPFEDVTPIATAVAVLFDAPRPALKGTSLGRVIDGLLAKDSRLRLNADVAYAWLREIESELTWPSPGEGKTADGPGLDLSA
jgi:serine/threonine protein kinase